MNFLMRSSTHVDKDNKHSSIPEPPRGGADALPPPSTPPRHPVVQGSPHSLESLLSEDPYARYGTTVEQFQGEIDGENGVCDLKNDAGLLAKHFDVTEDEGWIAIPYKELPEDWNHVSDIKSLRPLDRSFLFPGEQVHIVACLSACKQDTEIITPFKVAAAMSKNHIPNKENGKIEHGNNSVAGEEQLSPSGQNENKEKLPKAKADHPSDVSSGESLLRMEVHKRQTASLLDKFKSSHFFVRICESDEPLWSKHGSSKKSIFSETNGQKISSIEVKETVKHESSVSAVIDTANFDATISGGVARNSVKCCALPNGDIVVLLQVNVGVNFLRDPCIEILQYEKYEGKILSSENQGNSLYTNQDPCGDLLKWILPLDNNVLPSGSRPISPSHLPPTNSGTSSTSQRYNSSPSSGPQIFSFGSHFRSYSMSSLPQNTIPPPGPLKAASSKPDFDTDEWDQISSQKFLRKKNEAEELLSFRGVSLERERFSVCCGLQGIYTPGRRWRRKLEIIQPVEIHSFAADCNSEDLLCVQIKNVAPLHAPDIVIFIDAITIIFEEATKAGPPSSLPFACIEAGNDHSLPNLSLRRGEEHSFILKPATSVCNHLKVPDESPHFSKLQSGSSASKLSLSSNNSLDRSKISTIEDQYAVMVSCRCNYTTSKLFFKQPTSWRPRMSRDIMISVASETSGESPGPSERNSQLAVQVLTLQASNLTSEDLTLTVLAPASFISPPSVVSLSSPATPSSPFIGFTEFLGRINDDGRPQTDSKNDVIPNSGVSCTHLWLQSRVPLGCIPSQSTSTIKLELLPLTDGTITLDSLQIDVKEKGVTYIPERTLKINATSSISKGII